MKKHPLYLKIISSIMAALFLLSAAVQYNDPDGILWMGIYGAAAIMTIFFVLQRLNWIVAATCTAAALIAALVVGLEALNEGAIASAFNTWQMHSTGQEKVREAGGLLVVGLWLLVITIRIRKTDSKARQSGNEM